MTLPCDRRSDEDHLDDLNAALEDPAADVRDLVVGVITALLFWSIIALVVLA
ncbi:MAG: hypothetical protein V4537_18165 [Pseudomonadota bacterium]